MAPLDTTHEAEVDLEAGRQDFASANNKPSQKTKKQKRRTRVVGGCCCRVACGVLLAAALVAAVLGGLYLALDPKLPRYTVHAVEVTAFGMDDDMTARATFDASVAFENPNRAIGIRYEEGSDLSVWFGGYRLSRGALPAFYQGPRGGAAVVRVAMSEARLQGTGVVEVMRHVNNDAAGGELPLVFRGEVPVRVKVGPFTTGKLTPSVRCDLVLNRLATEGSLGVKTMDCKLSIKLW
ncbi:NDR1/HIN1-like protein 6 [Sorghum bicolor]|uniref:Late embryogenesis abundant protein LEA-2 subgroup domain-containing protein n=1 Tax=Sorghum bicolor TaxID=4558 RepID=C5XSL5_SORBI|nr:NDR1/HIN1-like protein 6 [Sorghum bicolor]EES06862.1 hypothetical protein SORBI_3004G155000 [Sorghum bicolor]|eukprot:XP_002453886.1 NDR1/HIN1-like protein 6 [Sorghum bicolor]